MIAFQIRANKKQKLVVIALLIVAWFSIQVVFPKYPLPSPSLIETVSTNLRQIAVLGKRARESGREFGFADASETIPRLLWTSERNEYISDIHREGEGWVITCRPKANPTYYRSLLLRFLLLDFRKEHWPTLRLRSSDAQPEELDGTG